MTVAGLIVGSLGAILLVVAALGLFRLKNALARQHAATKSGTLALGLVLSGVALQAGELGWWVRVALIVGFLFATLPVASHLLARAAAREDCPHQGPDARPLDQRLPGDGRGPAPPS